MEEIWKEIGGYEGYYEVSNLGRVRSMDRVITRRDGSVQKKSGKVICSVSDKDGYPMVNLYKDGKSRRHSIHSLVALAFVDGWFEGAEVNHIDFDRSNSCATNLEWVSHHDNILYSINAGHHVCTTNLFGENNPNYGNHTLSEKYRSNPELSKEKQGRPGTRNGRARSVKLFDDDGVSHAFGTIKDCAEYIVLARDLPFKVDCVSVRISESIKKGISCYGFDVKNA